MDYNIEIEQKEHFPKALYKVVVSEEGDKDKTFHHVVLSESYYDELSEGEVLPEELVKVAFMFLLEREPNTAILPEFSIKDISEYFPEFEGKIRSYFKYL